MLMLQCDGCGTQSFADCSCPPGHALNVGAHHPECPMSNLDANLTCPPDSGCCTSSHDHGQAANACTGNHTDAACPEPAGRCKLWNSVTADARHPLYGGGLPLLGADHKPGDPIPPCPGGHCHKDVPGCTVCRPLTITVLPGGNVITPVVGV